MAVGMTLIVRPLIADPLKPSGSDVDQVTVVPAALGKQSAIAALGRMKAPTPTRVVPIMRRRFAQVRLVID